MTGSDLRGTGFAKLVDPLDRARVLTLGEVPTPADEAFAETAKAYRAAGPELQQEVRELMPTDYGLVLLAFGERAGQWALDTGDTVHLDDALTAHCLEDFRNDPRDNIMHLSFLWRIAELIACSPSRSFIEQVPTARPRLPRTSATSPVAQLRRKLWARWGWMSIIATERSSSHVGRHSGK